METFTPTHKFIDTANTMDCLFVQYLNACCQWDRVDLRIFGLTGRINAAS